MASSSPLPLLLFLSLLSLSSTSITVANAITIPLSHFHSNPPQDPYQRLSQLASISQKRAHHLKNPQTNISTIHLFPHGYGGYTIFLSFGTPPQTLPFIMDTGSHFVWFPCTRRYICRNCNYSDQPVVPSYLPKQSSSSRVLGCLNPKCGLIHNNDDVQSRCQDCEPSSKNCTQICPPYLILYGSGSTGGISLIETLDLQGKKVPEFVVGCSLFSSNQPAGIAGFGRGPFSLPTQIGLKKFSYCLVSHKFDDSYQSGFMVFDSRSDESNKKTKTLSYTQLLNNPVIAGKSAFAAYYYVGLRKITVGGQKVKIPSEYLTPASSDGNGGTIVDSGTTFTYMAYNVFELIVIAFTQQVKEYERNEFVELQTGLRPCFNVSGQKTVTLPEMRFHFKGGAEMGLPLANYFSIAGVAEVVCLTMVTDREMGERESGGPSVILGNFQMQNFHTEFDLKNQRFGFRQQQCKNDRE